MTANLSRGRADVAALVALLDRHRPDVVALQELGRAQASVLGRRYGFGVLDPGEDGDGHGLVSSLPMTVERLALPGRSGLQGEARAPWGRIQVMTVHLLHPFDARPARAPSRRRQVSALCDLLDADPTQRVLLGDLNATPGWPTYRRLTRRLDDAVAHRRDEHLPWSPRTRRASRRRTNHVFASGLVTSEVKVLPVKGSDHRAVLADLAPTSVPSTG